MDLIGDAKAASAIACIIALATLHKNLKMQRDRVAANLHHERAIIEHPRKLDAPTPDKRKLDS